MLLLAILIEVRVLNTAQIVGGPGMYDNIIHTYHDYQQQMATLACSTSGPLAALAMLQANRSPFPHYITQYCGLHVWHTHGTR